MLRSFVPAAAAAAAAVMLPSLSLCTSPRASAYHILLTLAVCTFICSPTSATRPPTNPASLPRSLAPSPLLQAIAFDATAITVERTLESLPTIGDVEVTYASGVSACTSGGNGESWTFWSNLAQACSALMFVRSFVYFALTFTQASRSSSCRSLVTCLPSRTPLPPSVEVAGSPSPRPKRVTRRRLCARIMGCVVRAG